MAKKVTLNEPVTLNGVDYEKDTVLTISDELFEELGDKVTTVVEKKK